MLYGTFETGKASKPARKDTWTNSKMEPIALSWPNEDRLFAATSDDAVKHPSTWKLGPNPTI